MREKAAKKERADVIALRSAELVLDSPHPYCCQAAVPPKEVSRDKMNKRERQQPSVRPAGEGRTVVKMALS